METTQRALAIYNITNNEFQQRVEKQILVYPAIYHLSDVDEDGNSWFITISKSEYTALIGGTGSPTNYNSLNNKPQINGTTLIGNITLNDLGVQPKGDYLTKKDIANKADKSTTLVGYGIVDAYTKNEIDNQFATKSQGLKADTAVQPDTLKLYAKIDMVEDTYLTKEEFNEYSLPVASTTTLGGVKIDGNTIVINDGVISAVGGGSGGTTNYNTLSNKPQINGITLSGNQTSTDLGLQPAGDYATTNDLANKANKSTTLSGYGITDAYTKTESDTKYATSAQGLKADSAIQPEDLSDYLTKNEANSTYATITSLDSKANKSTTLSGYGIEDAYTKSEIDSKISSVFVYKGNVNTVSELPTENNKVGDVYNVLDTDDNYAWNGTQWDKLGGTIDLSAYATKNDVLTDMIVETNTTVSLEPEKFYSFGEVAQLNITLTAPQENKAPLYAFEFISGTTPTTLNIEGISWVGGTPTIEASKTYQVSILNNIGVIAYV